MTIQTLDQLNYLIIVNELSKRSYMTFCFEKWRTLIVWTTHNKSLMLCKKVYVSLVVRASVHQGTTRLTRLRNELYSDLFQAVLALSVGRPNINAVQQL